MCIFSQRDSHGAEFLTPRADGIRTVEGLVIQEPLSAVSMLQVASDVSSVCGSRTLRP